MFERKRRRRKRWWWGAWIWIAETVRRCWSGNFSADSFRPTFAEVMCTPITQDNSHEINQWGLLIQRNASFRRKKAKIKHMWAQIYCEIAIQALLQQIGSQQAACLTTTTSTIHAVTYSHLIAQPPHKPSYQGSPLWPGQSGWEVRPDLLDTWRTIVLWRRSATTPFFASNIYIGPTVAQPFSPAKRPPEPQQPRFKAFCRWHIEGLPDILILGRNEPD
jgi:hypothetical protein